VREREHLDVWSDDQFTSVASTFEVSLRNPVAITSQFPTLSGDRSQFSFVSLNVAIIRYV